MDRDFLKRMSSCLMTCTIVHFGCFAADPSEKSNEPSNETIKKDAELNVEVKTRTCPDLELINNLKDISNNSQVELEYILLNPEKKVKMTAIRKWDVVMKTESNRLPRWKFSNREELTVEYLPDSERKASKDKRIPLKTMTVREIMYPTTNAIFPEEKFEHYSGDEANRDKEVQEMLGINSYKNSKNKIDITVKCEYKGDNTNDNLILSREPSTKTQARIAKLLLEAINEIKPPRPQGEKAGMSTKLKGGGYVDFLELIQGDGYRNKVYDAITDDG